MKTAIILHGNLRTFFIPTRENPQLRVCDIFMKNLVEPNDADIFVSTDTNDFYYNDCQYFQSNQIDIVNNDPFRLYLKVGFMPPDKAKEVIEKELRSLLRSRLKGIIIHDTEDLTKDEKCILLRASGAPGASPVMITGQYKKLLSCYNMIKKYEETNNINYEIFLKTRFDTAYQVNSPLRLNSFNLTSIDVYVPTVNPPLIHDFFAFGNKMGMIPYLKLYEQLGCTLPDHMYMLECRRDGAINYFGSDPNVKVQCKNCHKTDMLCMGDVTIASEHHIYHIFNKMGIKYSAVKYHSYIYRYREVAYNNTVDNIIKNELQLKDITLVNHTPNSDFSVKKY